MPSIRFIAPRLPLWPMPSALAAARARRAAREEQATDAPARGCGWFDSSYELSRGLLVTEHRDLDDGATLELAVDMAIQTGFTDWLQ